MGVPKWTLWAHASAAFWAFGGAPYGATKRVRVCVKMGAAGAFERMHIEPSVGFPYGATKRVRGVQTWARWAHASAAICAFGGAPYRATKRVRGVPKWARWAHASAGIWAFGGAHYGATKR
eukprot:9468322-Pyramimonas_sp.AAC.1